MVGSFLINKKLLVLLLLCILLRFFTSFTADLSFLLLALYALFGRTQAIQSLILSWLFMMLNTGIAPEATSASFARYLVLFGSMSSVVFRCFQFDYNFSIKKIVLLTIFVGYFIVIHSWLFSPIFDVSFLKALFWTLTITTLISAWTSLTVSERTELEFQLFVFLIILCVSSLPFLFLSVGYLRNGTGFQGVLNHPQAFGPVMALLGSWIASRIVIQNHPKLTEICFLGICILLILLSEARTAGLAMILGMCTSMIFVFTSSKKHFLELFSGVRSKKFIFLFFISLFLIFLKFENIEKIAHNYISKSGRANVASILDAYQSSRGGKMDEMLKNIQEKPLQGIGFGIPSDPYSLKITRDPFFGLPTGASVEKGVMPLAVLEELGLIGFGIVAMWIFMIMRFCILGGLTSSAVALTAMFLNLGEATFFSPGGFGLLSLVLIGWAIACGLDKRVSQ